MAFIMPNGNGFNGGGGGRPQIQPRRVISATPSGGSTTVVNALPPSIGVPGDITEFSLGGAIVGAVGGFLTGGPAGAFLGAVAGGSDPPSGGSGIPGASMVGTGGCPPFTSGTPPLCVPDPFGLFDPGKTTGTAVAKVPSGDARGGRFGVGVSPGAVTRQRLVCPRGMVLGIDELCYDHLRNSDRKWPKGRRPLLTGGDLNAISRAKRVASRLEKKVKDLQKIGLMKKPKRIGSGRSADHGHIIHRGTIPSSQVTVIE